MDSGSTLRVEKTTLKPVIKKTYVLDTNVLLHDPTAVTAFKQHHVVIPMTVLEELDHIKDRHDKTVSREARIAIQMIDKVVDDATPQQIQEGVEMPAVGPEGVAGTLAIYPDQRLADDSSVPYLDDTPAQANDNRIINVALRLQAENPSAFICLVTKDINMRIKAKGSGLLHVEDYRRDRVLDDIDLLARGYEHIEGDFWSTISEVDTLREGDCTLHRIPRKSLPRAYPNMYLYDDQQFMAFVKRVDKEFVYLRCDSRDNLMNRRFWGLVPRNLEQAMAMDLLADDNVDMTVMTGPAGSGKTLLALAYGVHAILEQKRYSKLIVARSTPPIAEEIGFLPGTEEEKMTPWMGALMDNLEVLAPQEGGEWGRAATADLLSSRIKIRSLNFMRGRTFQNKYLILDEAQNLTPKQMKTLITRAGPGTKVICLGNIAQIDTPYLSETTSGLTYVVDRFKSWPHGGHVTLRRGERSRLAEFASEQL